MATVKNVEMNITKGNTQETSKVTVSYKLGFKLTELGKKYNVSVRLIGNDEAETEEPQKQQILHNFIFSYIGKVPVYIKTITAKLGEIAYSDSQIIKTAKLDEDPETYPIVIDINTVGEFPAPDEIYAVVTLYSGSKKVHEARSSVVVGIFA